MQDMIRTAYGWKDNFSKKDKERKKNLKKRKSTKKKDCSPCLSCSIRAQCDTHRLTNRCKRAFAFSVGKDWTKIPVMDIGGA